MSDYTQDERLISISTPLKTDELLLTSFEGVELISDLFEFQIEVLSKNHSIKPEQLIGKTITLSIHNEIGRTFNGFVSRFVYGEVQGENLRTYRLTMVPWLWFLSQTNNHRIFQEKTTKDIVTQVFQDLGFNDYEFNLSEDYQAREYCVQHNESDLNFISRLLEEEGISYFFEQKDDSHVMKIVDAGHVYDKCEETDLTYSTGSQPNTQINRWEHLYEFRKGKWSQTDYDFKTPGKSQLKTKSSTSKFANAKNYEHYEYTPFHDFSGIEALTTKRIEAEEMPLDTIEASGDCSSFYAGGKFNLARHVVKEEQGEYVIIAIRHRAYDGSYLAGQGDSSDYSNDFSCIPESVKYRPPLVHGKPWMQGPQSALVVGPSGEEIYIDEYGRIKVQFHWDREGEKNENSTCFLRVMQPWAGAGWGTSFIPRIGMEVVVNFFDGDPDRPVVTGSLYNGDNQPPYPSKTQSGIKTRSTKGGSNSNCNEFRFEDEKGSEQFYLHAEKDMDTEVENNETLSVDNNRTKTVGVNETSSIGKNKDKSVGENQSESVGKDKSISVGSNHTESIGANKTMDVGGNHTESIAKNTTIDIGDSLTESIGKDCSIDIGKDFTQNVGKNIGIVAGDSITLKTGSASIVMKKNGDITIKGKNVTVQGSGKINIKASSAVAIKGSKVTNN